MDKELEWRKNIHANLKTAMNWGKMTLAIPIVDAIDAAYVAGLDDQGRKANSGRLLYQDGYKEGQKVLIELLAKMESKNEVWECRHIIKEYLLENKLL